MTHTRVRTPLREPGWAGDTPEGLWPWVTQLKGTPRSREASARRDREKLQRQSCCWKPALGSAALGAPAAHPQSRDWSSEGAGTDPREVLAQFQPGQLGGKAQVGDSFLFSTQIQ